MNVRAGGRVAVGATIAAVGLASLLLIPAGLGTSWSGVVGAFGTLSALPVATLGGLWIGGLAANSLALAASLPGLSVRRALTLSLSGSAVANLLPLGGAAGVGLNYSMTRSWGFDRGSFATYTVTTNVCDVAAKLVVVAMASATLLAGGQVAVLPHGSRTALELLLVLPVLALLLLHQPSAGRV